jgi:hypothetical protein
MANENLISNAGTIISISASQPATEDQAGYAALTYTVIGSIINAGELPDEAGEITFNTLDERVTQTLKGNINPGTQTLEIGYDKGDAGMVLLVDGTTGAEIDTRHSIKVETKAGDIRYYQALIMSANISYGTSEDVVTATANIKRVTDFVEA